MPRIAGTAAWRVRSFLRSARPSRWYLVPLLLASHLAMFAQGNSRPANLTGVLLSDPHLDPFRDPAKAKRLAAAPAAEWAAILAEPPSPNADADFAALQKTCNEKLADADARLEVSAFNDAQSAHPAFVLVGGDMLVHAFGCRYHALLDASGSDTEGLAEFAIKTVTFQLALLQAHFPDTPIHLALGNNDSDCEDYALDGDSRFLNRLVDAVAAGWAGITPKQRIAARQDFKHFGSYALPLARALPGTRILVLDDLYLSSDYRGTCGKGANGASAEALLAWIGAQLAQAKRDHQAVWVLAHIPPEVNVYRTYLHPHDICHGEAASSFFPGDRFTSLLTQYADTVRVFVSGHTHIDEIHLLEAKPPANRAIALKTIPSLSPVSTNAPAYLVAEVDPNTSEMVDYRKRVATVESGKSMRWSTAYDFREQYHEPAFSASAVQDLLHRWQTSPDAAADQISAYQTSLASGLRLLAFRASWPQQLCAMQHSSAAAFAACACSATGGLLPPIQKAK